MEETGEQKSVLDILISAAQWWRDNESEIDALITWGVVSRAGKETHLYVPADGPTWKKIESAASQDIPNFEQIIVTSFSPGGIGFETLVEELRNADLLKRRTRELDEVVASIEDGRYFVSICGTLPLVEFVLSSAAGNWSDPRKHLEEMRRRLSETLAHELEAQLLIESSALEMVLSEIPDIWANGKQDVGAIEEKLNRHRALHGTTLGWADSQNATRALLLLAAAAKVASSLLGSTPTSNVPTS